MIKKLLLTIGLLLISCNVFALSFYNPSSVTINAGYSLTSENIAEHLPENVVTSNYSALITGTISTSNYNLTSNYALLVGLDNTVATSNYAVTSNYSLLVGLQNTVATSNYSVAVALENTVATSNYAVTANKVSNAAQTAITSVGTLTGLTVAGTAAITTVNGGCIVAVDSAGVCLRNNTGGLVGTFGAGGSTAVLFSDGSTFQGIMNAATINSTYFTATSISTNGAVSVNSLYNASFCATGWFVTYNTTTFTPTNAYSTYNINIIVDDVIDGATVSTDGVITVTQAGLYAIKYGGGISKQTDGDDIELGVSIVLGSDPDQRAESRVDASLAGFNTIGRAVNLRVAAGATICLKIKNISSNTRTITLRNFNLQINRLSN